MNSCTQEAQEKKRLAIYRDITKCLDRKDVGGDIGSRFMDSLQRHGECSLNKSELTEIAEEIIANESDNTLTLRQPLLSYFPTPFNTLRQLRVRGEEYLMANRDVLSAWKRGAITSWIDHLLSSGIAELIEGKRSFYLANLASQETQDNGDRTLLVVVICNEDAASSATIDAIAEATGIYRNEIVQYDASQGITTCLENGNITGDLSEVAMLAGLAGRPILLVRNGCRPAKSVVSSLYHLRDNMNAKVAIYGDCIAEEASTSKLLNLKGKPYSQVSLFESDITNGIVAMTPLSLIGMRIQIGMNIHTAWQELITSCCLNGVAFRHVQNLFGINRIKSIREIDIRSRFPHHAYLFPVKNTANILGVNPNQPRLSLASLQKASQMVEDDSNSFVISKLKSTTVTVIILIKNEPDRLTQSIRSALDRNDLPGIRVIAVVSNLKGRRANRVINNIKARHTGRLTILEMPGNEWNGSRAINYAAKIATSDYLLLHSSRLEIKSDWAISELITYHYLYNADIAGAKLLSSSGLVYHNGLALAYSKTITVTSPGRGCLEEQIKAIYPSQSVVHECTAVSNDFLLVSKDRFHYLGGMSPNLDQAFGDVDLCLRSQNCGGKTICITDPTIVYVESEKKGMKLADRNRIEQNRVFFANAHTASFKFRDEFHYGEIVDDKIMVEPGGIDFIVECGKPIETKEVLRHESIRIATRDIATIFVHFDALGELGEDVIFYLESLRQRSDIFFVSSSLALGSNKKALAHLKRLAHVIIVRTNSGYDFGSWSHVIQELGPRIFDNYEHLLLCNDSVIGPIHDLGPILDSFIMSKSDFGGLTASTAPRWHLQSYFVMYKRSIFSDPLFKYMWSKIREHPTKAQLINAYEIAFSSFLMQLGYNPYVHFDTHTNSNNNTHLKWKELIDDGFPFVKKELIRDNPLSVTIDGLSDSVGSHNAKAGKLTLDYCLKMDYQQSETANEC